MPKNLLLKAASKKKHKASHKAAPRKSVRKSRAKAPRSSGGGVRHKAYSYRNKSGKMVHVAAHIEHPHRRK